jgi:hypothetical protein
MERFDRPAMLVLATLVGAVLAVATPAAANDGVIVVRGELERLNRQAYDYHYRNSNRNVFRRSRHFHPTRNVFRSSRYYQQRLAASFDGYPLRTTYHGYGRHGRHKSYSVVYPRRAPYGPSPDGYLVSTLGCDEYDDSYDRGYEEGYRRGADDVAYELEQARVERPRPRTRDEIETVVVHVHERQPAKQKAVMQRVVAADGTVRMVITSTPVAPASTPETEAPTAVAALTPPSTADEE